MPGLGAEPMHHVHADDVAQAFQLAVERRDAAVGESFFAVSDRGWSVRGLAQQVAGWSGREPVLRPVGWEEFREAHAARDAAEHAQASWEHLVRSHSASTEKGRALLGSHPAGPARRCCGRRWSG